MAAEDGTGCMGYRAGGGVDDRGGDDGVGGDDVDGDGRDGYGRGMKSIASAFK
jgi:hypothetical protein